MSLVPNSVYELSRTNSTEILKRKHYEKWERFFNNPQKFMNNRNNDLQVRDIILDSWVRSKKYEDLSPIMDGTIKNISDDQLRKFKKENEIYHIVKPLIQKIGDDLSHSNHAVLFCDGKGIILDCYGDKEVLRHLGNTTNATKGSHWAERWAGTNAIGTSIETKQPVQIFSSEHFAQGCHEWICSSVPILNPLTKDVLGVINLSTVTNQFDPLTMVQTLKYANEIERVIFDIFHRIREMMQNIYTEAIMKWREHSIFLFDSNGETLWFNDERLLNNIGTIVKSSMHTITSTSVKEWHEHIELNEKEHEVKFKKIFWDGKYTGLLAILKRTMKPGNNIVRYSHTATYSLENIVGNSPSFHTLKEHIKIAASGTSTVIITGESGTGKELVANAIHKASERSSGPFVAINCAAIPKDLLLSELFGYVEGAFTGAHHKGKKGKFELANKGTIFLDEIGDMPLDAQVQILRVLQEQEIFRIGDEKRREIDVRVIAATNKNLLDEIKNGKFRKDLYYRLNVIPIHLPPLRERITDVPLLTNYFIQKLVKIRNHGNYKITEDAMHMLQTYSWPGNIRELENAIEYAVNFTNNGIITTADLPKTIRQIDKPQITSKKLNPVEQAELDWILSTLRRTNMNVSDAARQLKMSRSTLYRRLNSLGYELNRN